MHVPNDDVELIARDHELGAKVLVGAYELGGDVRNAYSILYKALGESHTQVGNLIYHLYPRDKANAVLLAAIKAMGVQPE